MRLITFCIFASLVACLHLLSVSTVSADTASAANTFVQIVAHRGASAERPECTMSAFRRAIEVGATAVEIDIRTSRDGKLFLMHDATLDRTTNGKGSAALMSLGELKKLDAGSWFDAKYKGERIPTLIEVLELCHGKIDVLLDLKEQGETYAEAVAQEVRNHGDAGRVIIGVRSVEQARQFRKLLPMSRQLGLIPDPKQIDAFAKVGVEMIRLWPKWLSDDSLVLRVRLLGVKLHLNGETGKPQEVLSLLKHKPDSLSADHPAALVATLDELKRSKESFQLLHELVASKGDTTTVPWISRTGSQSFLNRDYKMLELPKEFEGQPTIVFDGGSGDRVVLKFKKSGVIFAAMEYNDTGAWSFPSGRTPLDNGWRLLRKKAYRGTSNTNIGDQPHFASIYYCEYEAGQELSGLPAWWLCLAVMDLKSAEKISGFKPGTSGPIEIAPSFSYEQWATRDRPLAAPQYKNAEQWAAWQDQQRRDFRQQLVFPYEGETKISEVGDDVDRGKFLQQEFEVSNDGRKLFRFFRLTSKSTTSKRLPTVVCFMGHGKVEQILEDRDSYQHACAEVFAEHGYLVFAMENVGMEPGHDTHHELDRLLRLDGYSWYSLLFAHQQILLDYVFTEKQVDAKRVGVTGVSTGGLLALSAASFDPRVAATSVQGIFGSMRVSFIRDRNRHCSCGAIPGLLPQYDLPEMALLVAPRPIHFSNAVADGFGPPEAKRCVNLITPLYLKAGGAAPEFSEPPGRHEYAINAALAFFKNTIGKPE